MLMYIDSLYLCKESHAKQLWLAEFRTQQRQKILSRHAQTIIIADEECIVISAQNDCIDLFVIPS